MSKPKNQQQSNVGRRGASAPSGGSNIGRQPGDHEQDEEQGAVATSGDRLQMLRDQGVDENTDPNDLPPPSGPLDYKNDRLTRTGWRQVMQQGGSVMHKGMIYTSPDQIPPDEELAGNDPHALDRAEADIERQMADLDLRRRNIDRKRQYVEQQREQSRAQGQSQSAATTGDQGGQGQGTGAQGQEQGQGGAQGGQGQDLDPNDPSGQTVKT